jgi:predicted permease
LQRVAQQLSHDYPKENEGVRSIELTTPGLIGNAFRRPVTAFAAVVMGVACLVLLLACINLAGLLLARASDRRREIAVRLSIGAGRGRLVRQLLNESLLLAVSGAIAGSLLAFSLNRVLKLWHPPVDVPINTAFDPDLRVLGFTCLLTLVTTFLCGLVPALQSTKVDLVAGLKSDAPKEHSRGFGMRDILVVAQIGLSMILLITSLLVVRSLQNALQIKLGFDPAHAVSVSFDLGLQGYTEARGRDFQARLLQKVSSLPSIQAAGLINNLPLRIGEDNEAVSIVGKPKLKGQSDAGAHLYNISPGYLRAAGTRLLVGRDIDSHDRAGGPPVALVNETFVRKLLPNEDPIGKRFRLGLNEKALILSIAGVVEAGKYESMGEDPDLAVFVPIAQHYNGWTTLVARTFLEPREALHELRRAVSEMDTDIPLFNVENLEEGLAWPLLPARFAAGILGSFGALAVLLAAIGVFALVAYAIARRSREIGIRMALGARAGQVLALVLRRMVLLCTIGAVLGTALALAGSRALSTFLYDISPHDPLTYMLSLLLLTAVAILACWHPARRAIRIDPARTLREE